MASYSSSKPAKTLACLIALMIGSPAMSEESLGFDASKLEAGLSFGTLTLSHGSYPENTTSLAIFRIGYEMTDYLTAEGEMTVRIDGETIGGQDYENYYQAAFVRADYTLTNLPLALHARVGILNTEGRHDDRGAAIGVGASLPVMGQFVLRGDATIVDLDIGRAEVFGLGLNIEF
ncbi:porin family protein [Sedimentimonas flavescens]|uniref:Porin family protein n=1 Tax=Sedimentimonas flavescens TaxID=2851012 RepID=A0ABT2ZVP8_9RHOB|nr:porin family protein [Sedimentimonas flavescens]MCV2877682.1 porin family protein [Sedimentimonas flavescens]